MANKRLFRSRKNRVFAGVIGGLAEYFHKDVVLLRLITVVLMVFTGFFPLGLIYVLAIIIVPEEST